MANNDVLEINVGPLTSFNSLNLYLSPGLDKLRTDYTKGKQTIPVWDLRNIYPKKVAISALVAFLSISKKIRDFIGQPIEVISLWQPEFQGFLSDIGFVQISQELDLFDWKGMLGGFPSGKTNPHTKIFYYSNLPLDFDDHDKIVLWKDKKRQEIKHSMLIRLNTVFDSKMLNERWSKNLESVLTITAAELIVNSLLHGRDTAFVGVQRSPKRITTTICDAGFGFPRSMRQNHEWLKEKKLLKHNEALLIASLLSKNKIGLYRAVDDVILTGGYVIISSFDSEIRWERKMWEKAKDALEDKGLSKVKLQDIGDPIEGYVDTGRIYQGYYKMYPTFLVGSRITFEIPL
jgi:hypothetical protein